MIFVPATFAAADSCAPSFAAIHDFQVGDVFQRQAYSATSAGGAWPSTSHIRKYAIVSKTRTGNTVIYRIRGLYRREEFAGGLYLPANIRVTYRALDEALELADSTRHGLNACQDDSVALSPYYEAGRPVDLHTRVRTSLGIPPLFIPPGGASPPPRPLKQLGGDGNVYRLADGKPVAVTPLEVRLEYLFAEGLGLVRYVENRFETVKHENLQGYVREGDTVGVVQPDAYFLDPITSLARSPTGNGRGGKTTTSHPGFLFHESKGSAGGDVHDLRGRRFTPDRQGPATLGRSRARE